MTWNVAIDATTGWPKPKIASRHLRDEKWELTIGLHGPGLTPEQAVTQVVADAAQMVRQVLAADETTCQLTAQLKDALAQRDAPAGILAGAENVLTRTAGKRADSSLLVSADLGTILADLDRQEELARSHRQQAGTVLENIDARIAKTRAALEKRRRDITQLVMAQVVSDLPRERQLVADALAKVAGELLTMLAGVEAAAWVIGQPDLLERVLQADQPVPV